MTPDRRTVLGAGLAALAAPAWADETTDAAPEASNVKAWTGYEARLRARLADAGGGRIDPAAGRAAFDLTNRVRAEAGVPPLSWHDELAAAASSWCQLSGGAPV